MREGVLRKKIKEVVAGRRDSSILTTAFIAAKNLHEVRRIALRN